VADVNIRSYEARDRAAVVALWSEIFPDPPAHNVPDDDIDRKLGKDPELFLIAETNGTASGHPALVGTCMAGWDGHRGFVWYVGVKRDWQNQGIGIQLMREAEQQLWRQGCRKVNLMIRAGNEPVIQFYEKLGYVQEDRACMGKLLGPPDAVTVHALRDRAERFRRLHNRERAFVIANPWDLGSAKILESAGFEALATTSAGYAFSRARLDGAVSRDAMLAHCRELCSQTDLPVSADLENGYATDPDQAATTYTLAGETGLVGASIEDASGDRRRPIFAFDLAVARVQAAVAAVRQLPFEFVLTARAENYLHGTPDLDDTIKRLQAFEQAGADVLYAPGLKRLEDIRTVCSSVSRPVNVVIGTGMSHLTVDDLSDAGVSRISLGSSFARVAIGALLASATETLQSGRFDLIDQGTSFKAIARLLSGSDS